MTKPTPTQAWLAFQRQSMGYSLREAAAAFGTTRSVMQRAERGGPAGANDPGRPGLLDRVATAADVSLGSWPAPDPEAVQQVLRWWRQHPFDRLARCMKTRVSDWQTPLRHVARQLWPLPAVVTGDSALDLLLPPEGRAPPAEWTLACPLVAEPCRLVRPPLGVIRLESPPGLTLAARASAIPNRFGKLEWNGLLVAHPRDLILVLGWSPALAAAVGAADAGGQAAMSGVGHPRQVVSRHESLTVHVDDGFWDDID